MPKTYRISFRCDDALFHHLSASADLANATISQYIRSALFHDMIHYEINHILVDPKDNIIDQIDDVADRIHQIEDDISSKFLEV